MDKRVAEAGMMMGGPAQREDRLAAGVPPGRFGRPSARPACVALLAGDDGSYFVGQVLSPNGGTVM